MTRPRSLSSLCLLLLTLAACADPRMGDPAQVKYAPALGVDLEAMTRSETGLYTQDLERGTGLEATPGRVLKVEYVGWFTDGLLLDTTEGRSPFSFTLGQGRVIAGWDEGLRGMKVQGRRRLVIPSNLAYGAEGTPNVPPYSVLIFDVALVDAR